MRTSASFDLFPDAPGERDLARARWLAREGRLAEALHAYRDAIARQPETRAAWAEGFELLRRAARRDEALAWAQAALEQFGDAAFSRTLEGAALIELGRYRDALVALERAVDHDPDLALVWHEIGHAAHKLGEPTRALAALDRAFALEPHTATLMLRGRVLLDAGRHVAAEVAFDAAAQGAPHPEQRRDAEAMIRVVRRFGLFPSRRPADLGPPLRFFGRTGAVVLAAAPGTSTEEDVLRAAVGLASDLGWRFGQLAVLGDPSPFRPVAEGLGLKLEPAARLDPARIPFLAARDPTAGRPGEWERSAAALREAAAGIAFVLEHPGGVEAEADLVGGIVGTAGACDPAGAVLQAQHPAARIAGRRLAASAPPAARAG